MWVRPCISKSCTNRTTPIYSLPFPLMLTDQNTKTSKSMRQIQMLIDFAKNGIDGGWASNGPNNGKNRVQRQKSKLRFLWPSVGIIRNCSIYRCGGQVVDLNFEFFLGYFEFLHRCFRKKHGCINMVSTTYILYTRIHSHMMNRISNLHSDQRFVFAPSTLWACELNVTSLLSTQYYFLVHPSSTS